MTADISSERKSSIRLVDTIDRLECHADGEHGSELAGVHDVDEYVFGGKSITGEPTVFIGVAHATVVQIVNTGGEIVGLVGFALGLFLPFAPTEVMAVDDATEHGPLHPVGVVELQDFIRSIIQQGGVHHCRGQLGVLNSHVVTAQRIEAGRVGQREEIIDAGSRPVNLRRQTKRPPQESS